VPRPLDALQGAQELGRRGETVCRHASECAADGLLDCDGDIARGAEARDRLTQPFGENGLRIGSRVRQLARKHLIQHAPQRVDVGARIEGALAGGLLRAHIARRAHDQPGVGQAARLVPRSCDAEVGDEGRSVGREQQVLGLDVAMQDAVLVRVLERAGGFGRDTYGLVERQLALALQTRAQRFAFDEWHRVPEDARRCAGVEDGNDVGVLESRRELDFTQEAIGAKGGREGRT